MMKTALLAAASGLGQASVPALKAFCAPALLAANHACQSHMWRSQELLPTIRSFATPATAAPDGDAAPDQHTGGSTSTPGAGPRHPVIPSFGATAIQPHPSMTPSLASAASSAGLPLDLQHVMAYPVYTREYMEAIRPQHLQPEAGHERVANAAIQTVRRVFDFVTRYSDAPGAMTEAKWLQRVLFLETVAGVPGMVAGMLRHLKSLRTMKADQGWINTLLSEAENERMHLLTFMQMRQPGPLFRGMVILAQGVFFNAYFLAYLMSPRTCHSMVGFLEEEAVKTYTHALECIDRGELWADTPAPPIAVAYWKLPEGASMRDVILAVRADEAAHSHVNHRLASIPQGATNPFKPGAHLVA